MRWCRRQPLRCGAASHTEISALEYQLQHRRRPALAAHGACLPPIPPTPVIPPFTSSLVPASVCHEPHTPRVAGTEAQLPLPYRGQEAPELPPASELAALPEGPCRGFALKRCMTRSTVTPDPQRHASLALDAYVQFTSPIRRWYPGVAVGRGGAPGLCRMGRCLLVCCS